MGRGWVKRCGDISMGVTMPKLRTLVLFDMDGTLLDGAALIADTLGDAFLAAGEAPPDPCAVRATIGLSIPEMVAALAPDVDPDRRCKILNGYKFRYFDLVEDDVTPPVYPGSSRALARLSDAGFALGLATGKARRSVSHVLAAMGWAHRFHTIQCADANPSKPDPAMVQRAMVQTGRRAADTILVGDSRYDMQMARAAGIAAVGVSWGYTDPAILKAEGAQAIARDFDHLAEILIRMDAETYALAD